MKGIRILSILIIVVVVLFASTLSVNAIGFEAEKAYESVFVIYSGNSLGSGFAIGENCIVTNAHVIDDARDIAVVTYNNVEHKAAVLGINEQEDIAVLVIQNAAFPVLEVADLSKIKTGDDIYTIGAPKGMAYSLTKGGLSAKERKVGAQTYIQIDAPINEGNSGGPLLNDAGQVLGVNTLKLIDSEGIGLAIPISRVCDYLKALGLVLDQKGNVADRVNLPEAPASDDHLEGTEEKEVVYLRNKPLEIATCITASFAIASLIGNIVLAARLKNEKKKTATLKYDPSERTDFEIDILE